MSGFASGVAREIPDGEGDWGVSVLAPRVGPAVALRQAFHLMNLPNRLSLSRIIAVPVFIALLLGPQHWFATDSALVVAVSHFVALLLTILVSITDWLDGKIARDQGLITPLGKLLDPLADKVFVASAMIALSALTLVPAWAAILVVAREFLVTGLRSVAVEQGRVIAADRLGKHKTGWQLALIICALVASVLLQTLKHLGLWGSLSVDYHGWLILRLLVWIPLTVTVLLTIVSGLNYVRQNLDVIRE
jgi:CDP-diacylglycerol--glycerol-3-phosphate 3-phosphatidyltransferase